MASRASTAARGGMPDVAADVEAAAGPGTRLVRDDALERFDVLPLLVATDGAIASLGYDRRRFRPNLVIAGVPGLAERDWEGRTLRVGDALIGMVSLRQRCIMTTFDPDTAEQDTEVLLKIHRELDGSFALDCEVVQPGTAPRRRCRRASVTLPMAAADAMTIVNADASRHSRAIPGELRSGQLQVRDGNARRIR